MMGNNENTRIFVNTLFFRFAYLEEKKIIILEFIFYYYNIILAALSIY